jgi:hypothetical protein
MKKITRVRALGGIGNQLFVLFFGLVVSIQLKTELIIDDKLVMFGSNKTRKLEISKIKVLGTSVSFKENWAAGLFLIKPNRLIRRLLWAAFNFDKNLVREESITDPNFKFSPDRTFFGYYQDWFYADLFNEINSGCKFDLINASSRYIQLKNQIENAKPICVHVRLGDYLDFPEMYKILPEYYFLESIKHLKSNESLKVWIFSENYDQLKRYYPNLVDLSDRVIDANSGISDIESFSLLSNSRKLIASNSTFSLWAAWFVEKNNFDAVVPLQLGIKGASINLIDERWDRYDLENRVIKPRFISNSTYLARKREFLGKF